MSPRRIAKRYLPDPHALAQNPRLSWFRPLLSARGIWHFGRRSVAGGLSLGLFLAFVPIPIQQLLSIPCALLLRVNLPAALGGVWVSNPLTFAPIFYFAYRVGLVATGTSPSEQALDFSIAGLSGTVGEIATPLLVGCVICGVVSATLGNLAVRLLWRLMLVQRLRRKRAGRDTCTSAEVAARDAGSV